MRRLQKFGHVGRNPMCSWYKVKNPFRILLNAFIIELSKPMPSVAVKRMLWRIAGAKIGRNVAIGPFAQLDPAFPELVEIGDNTIIGSGAVILAHEFLTKQFRKGRTKIGRNVTIGGNAFILAGVTIGDNAVVSALSLVNRDVPPGKMVQGVPAKVKR
jgi:acetyltransferase-like isoleucine patch superfamily enzyme